MGSAGRSTKRASQTLIAQARSSAGEHPLIFVCLQESGEVVLDGARGVVDAMVATAGHEAPGQANSKTSRLYQLRRKQFFIKPEGARPTSACRLPVRSAE